MRIVNRAGFLAMPAGTIYAKFAPHYFGELAVKWDSMSNDWIEQSLNDPGFEDAHDSGAWAGVMDAMLDGARSPAIHYDSAGRDGLFDDDQLFAVWDHDDALALIGLLRKAVLERFGDPT